MNNIESLFDFIGQDELEFTQKCYEKLISSKKWDSFINDKRIKNIFNICTKKNTSPGERQSIKAHLFEIRVANFLNNCNLVANYEINSLDNKSVDFRISDYNILLELTSLRESESQKNKTQKSDDFYSCLLGNTEIIQSYFKIQKAIFEKSLKFNDPNITESCNTIIVDVRGCSLGLFDLYDCANVIIGSNGIREDHLKAYFINNGSSQPFPGIFDKANPYYDYLVTVRQKINFFGFINEKEYSNDQIKNNIIWFKNPLLESNLNFKEIFNSTIVIDK